MLGRAIGTGEAILSQRGERDTDKGQRKSEFHGIRPFPDGRFRPCFEGRYTPALRHVKGTTDARKSHLMMRCSIASPLPRQTLSRCRVGPVLRYVRRAKHETELP